MDLLCTFVPEIYLLYGTQIMFRPCERNLVFFFEVVDENKCLAKIELPNSLQIVTPYSKLQSYMRIIIKAVTEP